MQAKKTVIISCAGMGKRLGLGIVKALVDIDGKPLIIRTLEMLDNCKDIRVVVGYQAEKVIDVVSRYRRDVTFVFNREYMNNGTGASVSIAAENAEDYILTIDGDLLVHPDDMKKILQEENEFVGVCQPTTDDPVLTRIENEKVVGFSREEGKFEWTGVCLIKRSRLQPGDKHVYQLLEPLLPMKYLKIRTKEIDTMNDYDNAVRWVKNNYSDNGVIGVVGGMGSYATVDFFRRIVEAFPAEKEWDRPRIIIDNRCNMPSRVRAVLYKERRGELVDSLAGSVEMMINNGATKVVLACNTSHVFLNDVYEKVPDLQNYVINIIEECAKQVKESKVNKLWLMASEGTIMSGVYDSYFEIYGIKLEKPSERDFSEMRYFIEAVKQNKIDDSVIDRFVTCVNRVASDSIILGCTELPILYEKCRDRIRKKVFDPLQAAIVAMK